MATTKTSTAELLARIDALQKQLDAHSASIAAFGARIDAAAVAFKALRAETRAQPATRPMVAKSEKSERISRAAWDAALSDLRSEATENGSTRTIWPRAEVLARAATLAQQRGRDADAHAAE